MSSQLNQNNEETKKTETKSKIKYRARRLVIEKRCSFSCKMKNGEVFIDENAIIEDISMSGFAIVTKKNINVEDVETLYASFRDSKLVIVPLSGKIMRKEQYPDKSYVYGCSFCGYNASVKRYIDHIMLAEKTRNKKATHEYFSRLSRQGIVLKRKESDEKEGR